ncbi:uncharacterized protein LOC133720512 isoform X2 [Rosa rugosa]|uniref:uncharacterized protein LOC133720512 isoform X2 n=1 Tax=Rosa rugosa TaxID=74645 RepID=UPI002B4071A1|nr:uncharacterized protein LOC133720512 isoform X2 [Rosa rugosa]
MKNVGAAKMGRRRQEGCENGDGGEKKRSRTGLRSHKVDNFSELEWERGKGKRSGRVRVSLSSGKKPQGEPEMKDNVGSSEATAQTTQFLVFHRRAFVTELMNNPELRSKHNVWRDDQQPAQQHPVEHCSTVQPLKNFELRNCENERIEHVEREETGERQKEGREEEMEVQTDDQPPAQQPVEKCSIRQVSRVEETGGQREIIREEEEVQAIEEQPSPLPAEQCSIGHAWSEEEVGALNKGLGSEVDVQIIEVKQSQSSVAAGALYPSFGVSGKLSRRAPTKLGQHQRSFNPQFG